MSCYPACKGSLTSIVEALQSLEEDSSFDNRKKIAKLNGISDYRGSPEQNSDLLSKLKQGKLIKSADKCGESSSVSVSSEQKLKNIENSKEFAEKAKAMIIIGDIFLKKGYETSFVAGILANLYHEGNFGFFESSCYKSHPERKPKYFKIMEELGYGYDEKYSSKCVTDVSLLELKKFVDKLENDNWQKGKFGLGCFQWTGERTGTLVKYYLKENDEKDKITLEQVIAAEAKFVLHELESVNQYKKIYSDFKINYKNNYDSEDAAYFAGDNICRRYEVPDNKEQRGKERGNTAKKIFKLMS